MRFYSKPKETPDMDKMKMSPPWIQYCNMIDAMFGLDPDIKVMINDDGRSVKLFVDNPKKADAISQLLPSEKVIGNETVHIEVIPGDKQVKRDSLFETAFAGNPAFFYAKTVDEVFLPIQLPMWCLRRRLYSIGMTTWAM